MPEASELSIKLVLDYHHDEVVPALATALTIDDEFPIEVLNELRNAFTHLGRANKVAETEPEHISELEKALGHMRRACLDSLKVCIFALGTRSDVAIQALEADLNLPNNVYRTMSELRKRRQQIAAHEGQRPSDNVVEELKNLLNDYDEFYQSLDDQFAGDTAEERVARRARRERSKATKNLAVGFVLGVVGSIVATVIYNAF